MQIPNPNQFALAVSVVPTQWPSDIHKQRNECLFPVTDLALKKFRHALPKQFICTTTPFEHGHPVVLLVPQKQGMAVRKGQEYLHDKHDKIIHNMNPFTAGRRCSPRPNTTLEIIDEYSKARDKQKKHKEHYRQIGLCPCSRYGIDPHSLAGSCRDRVQSIAEKHVCGRRRVMGGISRRRPGKNCANKPGFQTHLRSFFDGYQHTKRCGGSLYARQC